MARVYTVVNISQYANDVVLLKPIKSGDDKNNMQAAIDSVVEWSGTH